MKSRNAIIASAVAIVTLAAGCASGSSGSTGSVGAAPRLRLEKTSIVVAAFPAIDSAGLYIAQMDGLFAAQGLNVKIVSAPNTTTSTQDLINGQISEKYDITAGDYVTYIENETLLGTAYLRIIAEASFLQPNVEALLVEHGIQPNQVTLNSYVPFSAVPKMLRTNAVSASFTAEPFVSLDEENA